MSRMLRGKKLFFLVLNVKQKSQAIFPHSQMRKGNGDRDREREGCARARVCVWGGGGVRIRRFIFRNNIKDKMHAMHSHYPLFCRRKEIETKLHLDLDQIYRYQFPTDANRPIDKIFCTTYFPV